MKLCECVHPAYILFIDRRCYDNWMCYIVLFRPINQQLRQQKHY